MAKLFLYMALAAILVLVSSIPDCTDDPNGTIYRGELAQTFSGKTCQSWNSQTPQGHSRTPANYPNAGLGDHNYCRNPDGAFTAWCYTTDPDTRWEYCAIGDFSYECTNPECYHQSPGADYRGEVSTTRNGRECQNWTSQSPHGHSRTPENYPTSGLGDHNLCRNPDGEEFAWCYTTDPSVRWEFCNIGLPEEGC
ncbi:plasminogen-like [Strongylocentrotus purpuratus]|uniref:Kringle domain-containing protein n=1 Tax=Strongylocentrotus purpuratus TaxID=7668 RepID=A0A7M7MYT1_STRPU|nr:plasminogen-like [Strongylocentrotus purpuratus]